jgi:hypothetical protein
VGIHEFVICLQYVGIATGSDGFVVVKYSFTILPFVLALGLKILGFFLFLWLWAWQLYGTADLHCATGNYLVP